MAKKMKFEHPCFDEDAAKKVGRIHLPVARKCNILCNYCIRKNKRAVAGYDKIIDVEEAVSIAKKLLNERNRVVGIAGPGDPLYNDETFETLSRMDAIKCVCTNGLLLSEKIKSLRKVGVRFVTVTMNAVDERVGAKIYSYVRYNGEIYKGLNGAKILIEKQLEGLRIASKYFTLKVNSVLIPGINDEHLADVSREISDYAYIQNVIPLVPQGKFSNIQPPSKQLLESVRARCEKFVKQMRHCALCRADAAGLLCENKTVFQCISELSSSKLRTFG